MILLSWIPQTPKYQRDYALVKMDGTVGSEYSGKRLFEGCNGMLIFANVKTIMKDCGTVKLGVVYNISSGKKD